MLLSEAVVQKRINDYMDNLVESIIFNDRTIPPEIALAYTFKMLEEEMPTFTGILKQYAESVANNVAKSNYTELDKANAGLATVVMGYGDLHNMVADNTKKFFGQSYSPEELGATAFATAAQILSREMKTGVTDMGKNVVTLPAALLIANLKGNDPEKYKLEVKLHENSLVVEAVSAKVKNIKVKHPGILEVPANKNFWQLPLSHYIKLGKKLGKGAVMKALVNLERWNRKRAPEISNRAKKIIKSLEKNKEWQKIPAK